MASWFDRNIVQPVAATGVRAVAGVADVAGADRSAQGLYRQASNITNQSKGLNDGIVLSNGLPMVLGSQTTTGGSPQQSTNANRTQQNETSLTTGGGGAGGGSSRGGSGNTVDPNAQLQYELGIRQANDALGRLDNQYNIGLGNIEGQYNQGYNQLMGQRALSDRNYETNKTQQLQDYQEAREGVATNQRNLLLNTRRLLGAQGAGGGSADRYAAPNAAQVEGANQNAVVKKTNTRNLGALDTAYEDDKRNIEGGLQNLSQQREQGRRSYESQIAQQRADILNQLATLTGQKAIAGGQTAAQAIAAVNPYTSRIGGILNQIDSLSANPATIRAQEIQLARPDLAQYSYDRFNAPTVAQQDPTLGGGIRTLLGLDEDQRQQLI